VHNPAGARLCDLHSVLISCGYIGRTSGEFQVYLRAGAPDWTFRADGDSVSGQVLQDLSQKMIDFLATHGFR
jgi:hypothetical protein